MPAPSSHRGVGADVLKEAPPPSLQASRSPSGHRRRDPPSPSSGRGGGRQPGGEAHNDPEDIRPHALIVLFDLPEGCRWAPRRRPRRDLRLGRDNPSTPVAGEISLPRSSRSQFIRSSLTRGSERCYCRARARTWGGRLRAGPRPLSFVDHGLRTTPLSGTSAPKCPLLDLQQICYLLSSVAGQSQFDFLSAILHLFSQMGQRAFCVKIWRCSSENQ